MVNIEDKIHTKAYREIVHRTYTQVWGETDNEVFWHLRNNTHWMVNELSFIRINVPMKVCLKSEFNG
jgi:hypothetical protein